jgi:hypothetical protein
LISDFIGFAEVLDGLSWGRVVVFARFPEFAEVVAAKNFDHFVVVGRGVLFEGLVHLLDGAGVGGMTFDGKGFHGIKTEARGAGLGAWGGDG